MRERKVSSHACYTQFIVLSCKESPFVLYSHWVIIVEEEILRPCKRCGSMFPANDSKRKICGACRAAEHSGVRIICKICGTSFIGRPNRTICDECRKIPRKSPSKNNPFAPYGANLQTVRCEICGTESVIRRPYGTVFCKTCGGAVYIAKIDNKKD